VTADADAATFTSIVTAGMVLLPVVAGAQPARLTVSQPFRSC
jgi:hypothetical protein